MFFRTDGLFDPKDIICLHSFNHLALKYINAEEAADKYFKLLFDSKGLKHYSTVFYPRSIFMVDGKETTQQHYYVSNVNNRSITYNALDCLGPETNTPLVQGYTGPVKGVILALNDKQHPTLYDFFVGKGFRVLGKGDGVPNANMANKTKIWLMGAEFD